MRRREFVAAMAATSGALAGCGQLSDGADSGGDAGPVTVETLDAPGSQSGSVTVPSPDSVTFVEFFATTCSVCAAQMSTLRDAYATVGDGIQFISITSEPVGLSVSREDVVDWWAEHGGEWPVALDDGLTLSERYDATAVPTAVVVRPDGAVAWSHTGSLDASTIVRNVRDARQGDQP